MSEQPRRHLPVSEKVAAVKRHLLEGTPVSQLCEELGIKPTVFYSWQKLLFENAHLAFDNGRKSKADEDAKDKKIEQLEAKLQRKNEVMAELMEEHTKLKKDLRLRLRPSAGGLSAAELHDARCRRGLCYPTLCRAGRPAAERRRRGQLG